MAYDFSPVLEASNILIKDMASKLRLDRTVLAEIVSLDNATTGEYRVKYEGNVFSAFSTNLEVTYKSGKSVYVKVPEGDFTLKKFIEGYVSSNAEDSVSVRQSVESVAPALDVFYECTSEVREEYGLISGTEPMFLNIWMRETRGDSAYTTADTQFKAYAGVYDKITIQADFKTELLDVHSAGNYGIAVTFDAQVYEDNEPVMKPVLYRLDFNSFTGNPLKYTDWATLSVTFKTTDNLIRLHSIDFFQDGMSVDNIVTYRTNEDGSVVKETTPNVTNANLFCTNVFVNFAEVIDYSDELYHLLISAPNGTVLVNTDDVMPLVGKLIYKGQDLMSESSCVCAWYKENLAMMVGVEGYDVLGGARWEKISSALELEVSYNLVETEQKYKLVCIYREDTILTAEITLARFNNDNRKYTLEITQSNDNGIKLSIADTKAPVDDIKADWYYLLVDGTYQQINEARCRDVMVNQYLLYNSITFYAAAYDGDKFVGNKEYVIFSLDSSADIDVEFVETDKLFLYDANGDITVEESELERTLYARVIWRAGYGASYKMTWYILVDGVEVPIGGSSSPSDPSYSMMKNVYVGLYDVVHYRLRPKYNLNYTNNTFLLVIETPDGTKYRFEKEQLFFKAGDPGTNGTSYVCVIRPVSAPTGNLEAPGLTKLTGFHALVRGSGVPMYLKAFIYKDGEEIHSGDRYEIEYNWDPDSREVSDGVVVSGYPVDNVGRRFLLTDQETLDDNCLRVYANGDAYPGIGYYVKVRVRITDTKDPETDQVNSEDYNGVPIGTESVLAGTAKQTTLKRTTLTYIYPIPVFMSAGRDALVSISAPQYVMYSASGLSAKFKNVMLEYSYDNVVKTELVRVTWDTQGEKMLSIIESESGYRLSPLTKYVGYKDNVVTALLCPTTGSEEITTETTDYLVYPIVFYLNTFGNESINGWDGTSIKVELDAYGRSGSYILAPQVGAGEKDELNRFSGVIMGLDSNSNLSGLYGYNKGVNTFGLRDDGSAYFGTYQGGGLIAIDGRTATIKGNYNSTNTSKALTIRLTNLTKESSDSYVKAIEMKGVESVWNSDSGKLEEKIVYPFYVTYDGKLHASNAEIEGIITANGGNIAGWNITKIDGYSVLQAGNLVLSSGRGIYSTTGSFTLSPDGKIKAEYGTIGGWNISTSLIKAGSTTLKSSGDISAIRYYILSSNEVSVGSIGLLQGNDGVKDTANFGIQANQNSGITTGIILDATNGGGGITLKTKNLGINLETNHGTNISNQYVLIDTPKLEIKNSNDPNNGAQIIGIYATLA